MSTTIERFVIAHKAKSVNLTISEFLRTLALKGQVDPKIKTLPKEVSLFKAVLNHIAANINQIAKKRNSLDELNAIERAELNSFSNTNKRCCKGNKKLFAMIGKITLQSNLYHRSSLPAAH